MIKRILSSIVLCISLSGCIWATKHEATIPEKVVKLDPQVYQPCKSLSLLPDNASFEELAATTATNFLVYSDCKAKQDNSIILLKQFSNYKEPK